MKHIHMKKPDIKGFFQKIRNLKMQDIKEHFKERKERRRQILEKRRNGKFARKMQPVYRMMNRLSILNVRLVMSFMTVSFQTCRLLQIICPGSKKVVLLLPNV